MVETFIFWEGILSEDSDRHIFSVRIHWVSRGGGGCWIQIDKCIRIVMLSLFICQVPTFLLGGWSIAIYSGNYIRKLNMNYESNYILELVHLVSISYQDTTKVSSSSWWPLPRLVSLPMTSFITRFLCVSHFVVYQCPFLTRTQLNLAQPAGDHCQDRSFYP